MEPIYIVCIILGALILWGIADILYDIHTFRTTRYDIKSDQLHAPFSFVVLSDLHGYRFGKRNERLVRAIDRLQVDAVLIAGDLLTAHKRTKIESTVALLLALAEKYPVYYSMGNHEERLRRKKAKYGSIYERYREALKGSGVRFLINESVFLEKPNIRVYGLMLTNDYFERFDKKILRTDHMNRKLGAAQTDCYNILIAHSPEYFSEYSAWGKCLVLSGHNHGGIIGVPFIGGLISPKYTFFPKYDGGRFDENGSTMLLSRGLGTHTIPVRMLNRAELVYVSLKPENESGTAES